MGEAVRAAARGEGGVMTVLIPATIVAMLASAVGPARSEPDVRQVVLEIDGKKLLDEQIAASAENTLYFVRSDSTKALSESHGVKVVDAGQGAPAILVSLSWVSYADSIYGVRLDARRPGEEAKLVERFECACVDSELTAAIIARLPAALEQLEAQPSEPAVEGTPPDPPGPNPEPNPPVTDTERDKPAALGAVGIVGIVVGAGGLGMVGFGASRIAKGETRMIEDDREQFGILSDARPQGRAWLGAGAGVAAVGVAMLVVDLTVLRKRRARAVAVVPSFGGGMTGLTVQGRF
jgi:hypothetical protein